MNAFKKYALETAQCWVLPPKHFLIRVTQPACTNIYQKTVLVWLIVLQPTGNGSLALYWITANTLFSLDTKYAKSSQ